jgi:hypothetical protein
VTYFLLSGVHGEREKGKPFPRVAYNATWNRSVSSQSACGAVSDHLFWLPTF